MTDREKVIKGLECCMSEKICNSPCPYKGQCDNGGYYFSKAIEDAIDLLKSQEPRVMTLEEVKDGKWDYCYLEYDAVRGKEEQIFTGGKHRITCVTWPSITSMRISPGDNEYGKRWRCWTSRPTEEQREAVKWND